MPHGAPFPIPADLFNRRKRGKVRSNAAQLSKQGRELLALLWRLEGEMQKTPGGSASLKNAGIRWRPAIVAEMLKVRPESLSRTLTSLERRELVFCLASGEGRGRRIITVKLTDQARAVAEHQVRYGMSHDQLKREVKRIISQQREERARQSRLSESDTLGLQDPPENPES